MELLFKSMPADAGIGFVLVVHLDPTHISLLPELLQKRTKMPVCHVEDGMLVERNHVIAEGAGATPVAVALSGAAGGGAVVCVVSGGNIDSSKLATILRGEIP